MSPRTKAVPVLEVRRLAVEYQSARHGRVSALQGISFSLAAGESVGVLGESGSGKSTLAHALMGLLPPVATVTEGGIRCCGTEMVGCRERQLRRIRGAGIALVPQEPAQALNPVLRVGTQVADVLRAHTAMSSPEAQVQARRALERVGLAPAERISAAYPHQLSGGQRQRVVLAQALACRPAVLIADEPTSSLDVESQAGVLRLLGKLQLRDGFALLLITHDPAVLAIMVERIIVLREGRVVEQGATGAMFASPATPYAQSLLGCATACEYAG